MQHFDIAQMDLNLLVVLDVLLQEHTQRSRIEQIVFMTNA